MLRMWMQQVMLSVTGMLRLVATGVNCRNKLQLTLLLLMMTASIIAASPSQAGVVAGPIVNPANGHYYYLLSNNTWTASEAEAVTMGGHLATIRNAAEDDWVYNTFSNYAGIPRSLWIGLNDLAAAGTFVWVSGDSSTYRNWFPGDPNFIGTERYVGIFDSTSNGPRKWANWGSTNVLYGVVEVINSPAYFSEDFENGLGNWTVTGTWDLITSDYRSATHSLTASPSGNYPAGTNSSVTLAHPLDLSGSTAPILSFWHKYDLAYNRHVQFIYEHDDLAYVEVSLNQGVTWTVVSKFSKASSTWTQVRVDLTPYKSNSVLIRFRLWDDPGSAQSTGWLIDDVEVKEKDTSRTPFPFFDNFEGSLSNWVVSGRDWSLTTTDYRSATHSIASNSGGNYPPNANETLELAHPLDLSGSTAPILSLAPRRGAWVMV